MILQTPEPVPQLLSDNALSLADWYGNPLDAAEADRWAKQLQSQSRNFRNPVATRFRDRLAELVARYWSGRDADMNYRNLAAVAGDDSERALLELCYGQLLLARRHAAARRHLNAGFALAAHLLTADDYFRVMKRHQLLAALPLADEVTEPSGLDALLKEAGVIAKLVESGTQGDGPDARKRYDTPR